MEEVSHLSTHWTGTQGTTKCQLDTVRLPLLKVLIDYISQCLCTGRVKGT